MGKKKEKKKKKGVQRSNQTTTVFLNRLSFQNKRALARLYVFSIILMLYSPSYPVNMTFQGAAAKLSDSFFGMLFVVF